MVAMERVRNLISIPALTWTFTSNDNWPAVKDSIDFEVIATDIYKNIDSEKLAEKPLSFEGTKDSSSGCFIDAMTVPLPVYRITDDGLL